MVELNTGNVVLLAFIILFTGLFLLLLPLLVEAHRRWFRFMDGQFFAIIILVIMFVVAAVASYGVLLAERQPRMLWPLGLFTCLFRLVSPTVLVRGFSEKLGPPSMRSWWLEKLILGAVVIMGGYTLYVSVREHFGWGAGGRGADSGFEPLIMTVTVIYSFSRFYLFIFLARMKESKVVVSWLAGLFIGVAYVLLVPEVLTEFVLYFGLAGALGWWTAAAIFHLDRRSKAPRFLRFIQFQ